MSARSSHPALFAPGSTSHTVGAPSRDGARPRLDDHVVTPEGREELIGGRLVIAAPANPEHADPHACLDAIMVTHVRPGYVASSDMLTRSTVTDDFATDTSVRRAGIDPSTGERYLEELAFEIVNTQSRTDVTEKAETMTARGVRRVFAVFVRDREVCEWQSARWATLLLDGSIEDACLAAPIPVRALIDASVTGAAAVRGLLARHEPEMLRVIAEGQQLGQQLGDLRGRRAMLLSVARARGLTLTDEQREQVERCDDAAKLEAWAVRVSTATSAVGVFDE